MAKDELGEIAKQLKARKRKLHLFDFLFEDVAGVVGIRVPTAEDSIIARIQAARDVHKHAGADVAVDDESIRVDQATLNLLSHVCRDPKDPDGIPLFGPPSLMARTLRAHEIVTLLDMLDEATRRERRDGQASSDEELTAALVALQGCERQDAVLVLGGRDREDLIELCWQLASMVTA